MKIVFSKENITFVLAVIGSVGTVSTWIFNWFHRRFKVRISVLAYNHGFTTGKSTGWYNLLFENLSRVPVSIKRLNLIIDNSYIPCRIDSQIILHTESKIAPGQYITRTTLQFPINLSELEAVSGYVLFVLPEQFSLDSATHLKLQVCTNRGTVNELTLPLDKVQNLQEGLFV